MVGQHLAQRRLRELDAGEGRRGASSRLADLAQRQRLQASGHERRRPPHDPSDPATDRKRIRGDGSVRFHHLCEGAGDHSDGGKLSRRRHLPGRHPRLHEAARLQQYHDRRSLGRPPGGIRQARGRGRGPVALPRQLSSISSNKSLATTTGPYASKVAVSLSEGGSEDGSLHIFDVTTGKQVGEIIPRVQYPTAGGSLAWAADSKGFYYTRYPGPERPAEEQHFFQRIYFHQLGADPASDAMIAGGDFPKVAEITLDNSQNHRVIVASVANGDGGEFAHYLIAPDGKITQVTRFEDKCIAAVAGPDDNLYLISRKDAPHGKLLRMPLSDPILARATEIVAQGEPVLQGGSVPVVITDSALYVRELVGGPSQVARFDHNGRRLGTLPSPEVTSVGQVVPLGNGTLLYSVASYLRPTYFARFDETSGHSETSKLAPTSPIKFDDAEVIRVLATSKDGTKVPINIIRRIGTKTDGLNPVLLNGYGGFGISQVPRFLGAERRLWLDGGGIFVIANLRGGGEYGEEWHAQGALTHKQNVFDDFIAAARYLIDQRYTTPSRLAIIGGSNGGLLMGATFTQHL